MANMALLGPDHYLWLTLGGILKSLFGSQMKIFFASST